MCPNEVINHLSLPTILGGLARASCFQESSGQSRRENFPFSGFHTEILIIYRGEKTS